MSYKKDPNNPCGDGACDIKPYPPGFTDFRKRFYAPTYSTRLDFNTNEKGFYDALGQLLYKIGWIECYLNYLFERDIIFNDTDTIDFTKIGNWQGDDWQTLLTITADVKISADALNALTHGSDGALYVNDLTPRVKDLEDKVALIQQQITEIYQKIQQLEVLISKIQQDITDIKNDITNINNAISNIQGDITNIKNDINTIKGDITNIKNSINNILGRLDDLQDQIDAISGRLPFTRLTKGTHYNLTFYNGFTSANNDCAVDVAENDNMLVIRFGFALGEGTILSNPDLSNVRMRHGASITDEPQSRIASIQFTGSYARINSLVNTVQYTNTWNIRPASARASWGAVLQSQNNNNTGAIITFNAYQDGYNTQLDVYEQSLSLGNATVRIEHIIYK